MMLAAGVLGSAPDFPVGGPVMRQILFFAIAAMIIAGVMPRVMDAVGKAPEAPHSGRRSRPRRIVEAGGLDTGEPAPGVGPRRTRS